MRLVLCEGAHDLWVMRRVLEHQHGWSTHKVTLDALPYPLGHFVKSRVNDHYLKVKAHQAGAPETPNFSLVMKHPEADFLLAFFTGNGGLNTACTSWLDDARKTFQPRHFGRPSTGTADAVASTSVAVLVDGDADPASAIARVESWWGGPVVAGGWTGGPAMEPLGQLGLWVWPDGVGLVPGTMEPVIDGVDGGPTGTPGSEIVTLLDEHAPDDCKYAKGHGVALSARRTKARLGVQAQWASPGSSWASWLRDIGLSKNYIDDTAVLNRVGEWLAAGVP